MSYDIKCKFFTVKNDSCEIISESIINELKNLNSIRYSLSFTDIQPTNDFFSKEVDCYIRSDKEVEYQFSILKSANSTNLHAINGIITVNDEQTLNDLQKQALNPLDINKISSENIIHIYATETNVEDGKYYDKNSFVQASLLYYGRFMNSLHEKFKLESLINSLDYYKLSQESKQDMTDKLEDLTLEIKEWNLEKEISDKMISLFDYFEENEISNKKTFCKRNSKVYCFMSIA